MKIFVKARAGAKMEKVDPPTLKLWRAREDGRGEEKEWFTVWVKERAVQGKANMAITKALAEHFGVANAQVKLISGFTSKQKIFEIEK